ncbi:SOS response-associated peptidase [uncultured Flavobacterium sp.]|uniref:SOS response-associated peptidase n=1 Tax=uncultured Flavobacterium sp. TaxID=165435 RepID=UPI002591D114|nr:SOS response-associated peptidase [uncultured Flavobacterium sp.]
MINLIFDYLKISTMCFHSKQTKLALEVENRFNAKIEKAEFFQPQENINGFNFAKNPIITDNKPNIIQHYNWGLIPSWSKDEEIKKLTLNARIETIEEKPSFKNLINKRCLVIANGYYEWQWLDSKGKNKIKYEIGIGNDDLFAFAGLYSQWVNNSTGEIKDTYTIVTTQANALMSEIHNIKKRMPIILKPEDEKKWLNHNPINDFAFPYDVNLIATKIHPDTLTLW